MPLLTIAIPTYNRSFFLKRCIDSIVCQLKINDDVELIVANNASQDDSDTIISQFITNHVSIKYIKRIENIGAENNFAECFKEATGKYFWIIGDDDFLLPYTLQKILNVLREYEYGLVYLNGLSHSTYSQRDYKNLNFESDDFDKKSLSPISFFKEYHFWATFITANIVNRSLVKDKINVNAFYGTQLIQLGWNIPASFASDYNAIIYTKTIGCEPNNTGGYQLVTVFSENYNAILETLIKKGFNKQIKSITNKALLTYFFPPFIRILLTSGNKFEKENHFCILIKNNWKYYAYWKTILPIYLKIYATRLVGLKYLKG